MKSILRIWKDKPCRVCGEVPAGGYAASKIVRNDWLCTVCENRRRKILRQDLVKKQCEALNRRTMQARNNHE